MTIVLATRNRKKVREVARICSGQGIQFVSMDSFPECPEVVEDGRTFRANAVKKAVAVSRYTGCPAIADDSGLEVEALDGAPGVFSARYAGEGADDHANVRKLLKELAKVDDTRRQARFVCCIALALPDGRVKTFSGYARGTIGRKTKGKNGFGYDPVFYPVGRARTFAEMSAAEKDALSHRGKALARLNDFLEKMDL